MFVRLRKGHLAFGIIYQQTKKLEAAENEYQQAMEKDPDNLRYQYNLASFYANSKKLTKAFQSYEQILKNNPHELNAYYKIGRLA